MTKSILSRRKFIRNSGLIAAGTAFAANRIDYLPKENKKIIDIHQHLHYVDRTDQQMIHHQEKMGATTTVLLPAGSLAYTAATHFGRTNGLLAGVWGNQPTYEFAKKHENYYFGVCEVPDLPDATKEIEKYLKLGAVIIGELKFGIDCDSSEMQAIYELAAKYQVPVLMHWRHEMFNYGFDRFYKMLEKFPQTNFIGHAQTWWANISGNYTDWSVLYPKGKVAPGGLTVEYLKKYPNMYGDLSAGSGYFGLHRDEEFAQRFLIEFQDKLVFGSDCHDDAGEGKACYGSQTIGLIRRLVSERNVRRKILFENAKRLLKLPV